MMVHTGKSIEARLLRVVAIGSVLLGLLVIIGYALDVGRLATLVDGMVAMRPVTGTGFILLGVAMLATAAARRGLALVLGAAVIVISIVSLISELTDRPLLVHHLPWPGLFGQALESQNMSPLTSASFAAIAVVLVLLTTRHWKRSYEWFLVLPGAMGIASGLALAYGITDRDLFQGLTLPALHTAVALTVMAYAIAMAIPNTLVHRITFERTPGGQLMRAMIPFVVFVLPVAAWIAIYGERSEWWAHGVETILLVLFISGCLLALMVRSATAIDGLHGERQQALQELHDLNAELNARVLERTATLDAAQTALEESAARYRNLFDAAPMGLIERDADGVITMANQRWADLHDTTVEQAIGLVMAPGTHTDDVAEMAELLASPQRFTVSHYRITSASGEPRFMACDMLKELDAAGRVIGSVSAVRDRTRGEYSLRQERAVRRIGAAVFDTFDQDLLAQSALGVVIDELGAAHSAMALSRRGESTADSVHTQSSDMASPITAAGFGELVASLFANREHLELTSRRANDIGADGVPGELGLSAVRVVPVQLGRDAEAIIVVGFEQPRPWTKHDHELIVTMSSIMAMGMTRAITYDAQLDVSHRLEQLDEAKSEFISSVTHELRTPLTSVLGYLDLVLDGDAGEFDEGVGKMLAIVRRNGERVASFVEDLLALSRLERWQAPPDLTQVNVDAVIGEVVTSLQPLATDKQLVIATEVEDGLPTIEANQRHLEQLVRNLTANAIKFTPQGGKITVAAVAGRTASDEPALTITVSDTGIGIPSDEVPNMFQRFYRASNAEASAIQGTGLGLAIVARIVEQHQGTIRVDSELNEGTTFTVTIPFVHHPELVAASA